MWGYRLEMQNRVLLLMQDIWRQGSVVEDWRDAVVVPIPKKGDLGYTITGGA